MEKEAKYKEIRGHLSQLHCICCITENEVHLSRSKFRNRVLTHFSKFVFSTKSPSLKPD